MNILQTDMLGDTPRVVERGEASRDLLPHVTSIVASISGGIDGYAALLVALRQLRDAGVNLSTIPIYLWHACLPEMDWVDAEHDYTDETLVRQWQALGMGTLVAYQAIYSLTGGETSTGFPSAKLQQLHCVRDGNTYHGVLTDESREVMTTLPELIDVHRMGNPPTPGIRVCTKFMKGGAFQWWLRRRKDELGTCPLVIRGERRAESHERRERLEEWSWSLGTTIWDAAVWLPCIDMEFHECARLVYDFGGEALFHPCYFWQSSLSHEDTLAAMLDPKHPERGRPRCSCVLCIFTRTEHIITAARAVPNIVMPQLTRMRGYETKWGKTWQQKQAMPDLSTVPTN